jgi:hypothetical protein
MAITGFVLEGRLVVKEGRSETPPLFIFLTTMYSIRIRLTLKQLEACFQIFLKDRTYLMCQQFFHESRGLTSHFLK